MFLAEVWLPIFRNTCEYLLRLPKFGFPVNLNFQLPKILPLTQIFTAKSFRFETTDTKFDSAQIADDDSSDKRVLMKKIIHWIILEESVVSLKLTKPNLFAVIYIAWLCLAGRDHASAAHGT